MSDEPDSIESCQSSCELISQSFAEAQKPMPIVVRIRPLSKRVLAVARTRIEGKWAAYIDSVPGHSHEEEMDEVLRSGVKLPIEVAKSLFPEFENIPYAP